MGERVHAHSFNLLSLRQAGPVAGIFWEATKWGLQGTETAAQYLELCFPIKYAPGKLGP